MSSTYRLLCDQCFLTINGAPTKEYRGYGIPVEFDDETAEHFYVGDNLPFLPQADFDAIGFSADELKKYPNAIAQSRAPEDFLEKKKKAHEAYVSLRDGKIKVLADAGEAQEKQAEDDAAFQGALESQIETQYELPPVDTSSLGY